MTWIWQALVDPRTLFLFVVSRVLRNVISINTLAALVVQMHNAQQNYKINAFSHALNVVVDLFCVVII